jgi:hypothetical protein
LYLYGSDRASILRSINRGRRGTMPGFDDKLKREEIKAVSVYVLSRLSRRNARVRRVPQMTQMMKGKCDGQDCRSAFATNLALARSEQ